MQQKYLLFTLLLTLCFVTGCSQATKISDTAQESINTVEIQTNTVTSTGVLESTPTITVIAETVETITDATATEETATPKKPDYCSECHMDKQMLIDTAKPQEEIVVENEGEG